MLAPDPLWRPTATSTRNDRDLIRTYLGWPVTEGSLVELTQQMNSVATLSPSTVGQVQGWLDEIVNLEEILSMRLMPAPLTSGALRNMRGRSLAPRPRETSSKARWAS